MKSKSKLVWLAAGASIIALSTAGAAFAQPLANPLIPSSERAAPPEPVPNYLRPRVGVQAAITDNVQNTETNKQTDEIGRISVGADGRYDSPRLKASINGDVLYDFYAKTQKNDSLNANGAVAASYIVIPQNLSLEAAGADTQGSLTTFGSTDFYRAGNANDYNIATYYLGPHVSISPGILDVTAAARYGQVFFSGDRAARAAGTGNLVTDSSFYQVIGAADTKDRLGRIRFVTSGQWQSDDHDFESTSGSLSSFFQLTNHFTTIVRGGYDDVQLTKTSDLKSPFWSVGGQYIFNEDSYLVVEGGQRYKKPYYSANARARVSRTISLAASYSETLSPGAISIANVLVDYVGGLDDPLPLPGAANSFGLNTTYASQASINRYGRLGATMDLGRQNVTFVVTYNKQNFQGAPANTPVVAQDFHTLAEELTYANQVREDLNLAIDFAHSSGTGNRFLAVRSEGDYYQIAAVARYGLNSRTSLTGNLVRRWFDPDGNSPGKFSEDILSIALMRQF